MLWIMSLGLAALFNAIAPHYMPPPSLPANRSNLKQPHDSDHPNQQQQQQQQRATATETSQLRQQQQQTHRKRPRPAAVFVPRASKGTAPQCSVSLGALVLTWHITNGNYGLHHRVVFGTKLWELSDRDVNPTTRVPHFVTRAIARLSSAEGMI
jgi:hypothetical protein